MDSSSKNWATEHLLDPLNAPQPSEEDGPGGTPFRPAEKNTPTTTITPAKSPSVHSSGSRLSKTNPYRKSLEAPPNAGVTRSTSQRTPTNNTYPSPPPSASPRREAFRDHETTSGRPRRTSSLSAKHPGDMSHRPLDVLTAQKRTADRSRHTTRKHHIQPDTIDSLDMVAGSAYHHSGPYDATLFARNNSSSGPLGALVDSNAETLRATPHEKIVDSVRGHRPLDGVAAYAPGETDPNGHTYAYRQTNMMLDADAPGGAYKRWPGVQYHPDDIKGKGEPSYTIEMQLKEHGPVDEKTRSGSEGGIEMKTHNRNLSSGHSRNFSSGSTGSAGGGGALASTGMFDESRENANGGGVPRRSGSMSQGLKKRWGSVRKHIHRDSE